MVLFLTVLARVRLQKEAARKEENPRKPQGTAARSQAKASGRVTEQVGGVGGFWPGINHKLSLANRPSCSRLPSSSVMSVEEWNCIDNCETPRNQMGLRTERVTSLFWGFWGLSLKIPYIAPSDFQPYLTPVSHTLSQAIGNLNENWEALRAATAILATSTIALGLTSHT